MDAYTFALGFNDVDMAVALVPVITANQRRDVAVVGVQPNDIAEIALKHERPVIRARAAIAMTIHAHRLLAANGLRFSCR